MLVEFVSFGSRPQSQVTELNNNITTTTPNVEVRQSVVNVSKISVNVFIVIIVN